MSPTCPACCPQTYAGVPVSPPNPESSGGGTDVVKIVVPIAVVCGILGIAGAAYAVYRRRQRKHEQAAEQTIAEAEAVGVSRRYDMPGTGSMQLATNPQFDPNFQSLATPQTASPAMTPMTASLASTQGQTPGLAGSGRR